MPRLTEKQYKDKVDQIGRLCNERSRVKHALQVTWNAFGIPQKTQDEMLVRILDGNRMKEFESMISCVSIGFDVTSKS